MKPLVGRHRYVTEWRAFITQLINQGLVSIDYTDFHKLRTTPLSKELLAGNIKVNLAEVVYSTKDEKAKKVPKAKAMLTSLAEDIDGELLAKLKAWRLHKARENKLPPYVIMHDSTLEAIAGMVPKDEEMLGMVPGIGEHKLKKYGGEILKLILNSDF
ncbi:MAG: HRDC domain-containing protein [Saprospiraceae bacterium]|nr:HRDC domain-containing protein [Saprospiraceae bacterium]